MDNYTEHHVSVVVSPVFPCELWALQWGWVYFKDWKQSKTPSEFHWTHWRAPTGRPDVSAFPGEKHPHHNPAAGRHCSARIEMPDEYTYYDPLSPLLPSWWHEEQLPFWFHLIPKKLVSLRYWVIKNLKTKLYLASKAEES